MTLFSSRPPFNDDPHPNVWEGHSPYNQMRADTDMYRRGAPFNFEHYAHKPRPEYDRPQHNPTNPILVAARKLFPGNVYYKDLERWPTEAEIIHAHKVLGRRKAVFG